MLLRSGLRTERFLSAIDERLLLGCGEFGAGMHWQIKPRRHFTGSHLFGDVFGVPLGLVFLVEVAYWIARATSHMAQSSTQAVSTRELSTQLFREYVFPFELTSFLILIAILGALVLARREDSD